jgi:hypothetical protein
MLLLHIPYDILAFLTPGDLRNLGMVEKMVNNIGGVKKPIAVLLHYAALEGSHRLYHEHQETCLKAGLPAFTSIEACATALDKFIRFHERKELNRRIDPGQN